MSGLNGQFNARLERLEREVESGGSGLPEYSSADKGKVLTLGDGTTSVTTVIVPEQTVTLTIPEEGQLPDPTVLTGADFSSVSVGNVALMSVNGVTRTVTAVDPVGNGGIVFPFGDENNTAILRSAITGDVKFGSDVAGTYTISLASSIPAVEPKWEAAGGGIFKVLADYSTGALDKNFRDIEAAITGGLLPVVFTQGASFPVILATLTNSVYTVCALSASPSSTQATLNKWGAASPTAPLTPLA